MMETMVGIGLIQMMVSLQNLYQVRTFQTLRLKYLVTYMVSM